MLAVLSISSLEPSRLLKINILHLDVIILIMEDLSPSPNNNSTINLVLNIHQIDEEFMPYRM